MIICTCQKEGIEAAAAMLDERAWIIRDGEASAFDAGDTEARARLSEWARETEELAIAIRALLTTPGQPCPRCEVVAAAEAWADECCTCDPMNGLSCDACRNLTRAIERMRS